MAGKISDMMYGWLVWLLGEFSDPSLTNAKQAQEEIRALEKQIRESQLESLGAWSEETLVLVYLRNFYARRFGIAQITVFKGQPELDFNRFCQRILDEFTHADPKNPSDLS